MHRPDPIGLRPACPQILCVRQFAGAADLAVMLPGQVRGRAQFPEAGAPGASSRMILAIPGSYTGMFVFIVVLLVIGFVVGLIARALVPGRDDIGILGTSVLGIVGSFVGGFLQHLVEYHTLEVHHFYASGIIGSIIGAIVVLLLLRVTGLERGRRRRRW
jgi:uncharacterized membrane protein YeaQ/YmgE (transglycosylase-associated protein family)